MDEELTAALQQRTEDENKKSLATLASQLSSIDDAREQRATAPTLVYQSGLLTFTYHAYNLTIELSRLKDSSRGQFADFKASTITPVRLLTQGALNLTSLRTRSDFARRLTSAVPALDWSAILEQVCIGGLDAMKQTEPATTLDGSTPANVEAFILNPLIYQRHPTLIYGPGDSGKSFLAIYFALLMAKGDMQNGLACSEQNVLFLDWELSHEDMDQRVGMLKRGHPELADGKVSYRRMSRPLHECLEETQALIVETEASVLIVDSIGLAAGAELERAETALTFFQALLSLQRPSLLIGHCAKNQEDGKRTPFGSVYFYNSSRCIWEATKIQEVGTNTATIGLYHTKNNLGPRHAAMGFTISFEGAVCTVTGADLTLTAPLAAKLTKTELLPPLLKALMGDHRSRSNADIALALNHPNDSSLRSALSRGQKDGLWHKLGDEWVALQ